MQDMQDMIERLNHSGRKLSKGHRRIAQYIVEHYDKAVFMTASRLGESVGVSESTVVRFAAVLGYEGYPQLQRALQELVSHRLTAVQRFEMSSEIDPNAVLRTVLKSDMQNIRATVEELFSDEGVPLHIAYETQECNSALQFVSIGGCVTVMPKVPAMQLQPVTAIPISDRRTYRSVFLAWRKSGTLPPAARKVRDFVLEEWSDLRAGLFTAYC